MVQSWRTSDFPQCLRECMFGSLHRRLPNMLSSSFLSCPLTRVGKSLGRSTFHDPRANWRGGTGPESQYDLWCSAAKWAAVDPRRHKDFSAAAKYGQELVFFFATAMKRRQHTSREKVFNTAFAEAVCSSATPLCRRRDHTRPRRIADDCVM